MKDQQKDTQKPISVNDQMVAIQKDLVHHRQVVSAHHQAVKDQLHSKLASKQTLWVAAGVGFFLGDRPKVRAAPADPSQGKARQAAHNAREAASRTGRAATSVGSRIQKLIKVGLQMAAWARTFNSLSKQSGQ